MKAIEIKVGIVSKKQLSFILNGSFKDSDNRTYPSGIYIAKLKDGKIVIKNSHLQVTMDDSATFLPKNASESDFKIIDVTIGVNFHWEKKEDQVFKGRLQLLNENDQITAINLLSVEDYLISVISSEMSATSSIEMLKAHAVISRSWLLAQIEKNHALLLEKKNYQSAYCSDTEIMKWYDREDHANFDVCADDHCQRYQGITRASTPLVEDAVKQTFGEVLVYDNHICDARFSKCCGGVTELFENVWEPIHHPYLQRVIDNPVPPKEFQLDLQNETSAKEWILNTPPAYCNTSDRKVLKQVLNDYDQTTNDFYRWKVEYSQHELSTLVKSRTGIDFGIIQDLIPVKRGISGRLIQLKIIGTKKTMTIGKELEIRKALSPTHLYSSAFIIYKIEEERWAGKAREKSDPANSAHSVTKPNTITVENANPTDDPIKFILLGAGWGHGVGLCQIGAAMMGEKGFSYKEILMHYFKGATLAKRY